jgi:hypothetical protein
MCIEIEATIVHPYLYADMVAYVPVGYHAQHVNGLVTSFMPAQPVVLMLHDYPPSPAEASRSQSEISYDSLMAGCGSSFTPRD